MVVPPESTPAITLVMPAWNEERYITPTLESVTAAAEHFRRERGGTVEIIVVDNGSTDHTAEIAEAWGCRVVSYTERHQMASVRNAGAAHARAPVICFVDSDRSLVPGDIFCEMHDNLQDPKIFGGGCRMVAERYTIGIRLGVRMWGAFAWLCGIGAIMFYMRRADFEALGGFDEEYYAAEDVEIAFRMKRLARSRGQHLKNLTGPVTMCVRKFEMLPKLGSAWAMLRLMLRGRRALKDPKPWRRFYYDVDNLR